MKVFKLHRKLLLLVLLVLLQNIISQAGSNYNSAEFDQFLKASLTEYKNRDNIFKTVNNMGIVYQTTKDKDIKVQFRNDISIIYKTMYPETKDNDEFNTDKSALNQVVMKTNLQVIKSLKSIIYTIAENGLYFSNVENEILNSKSYTQDKLWPHPFASLICHGGRITFLYDKKIIDSKAIQEYFFGENNNLLMRRAAASHKVEYDSKTKQIKEEKIFWEAAVDSLIYVVKPDNTPHFGMNLPIGGIGNFWPDSETKVGSLGYGIKAKTSKIKDPLQHGHMYVRMDELKESKYSSILLGLEEEAPSFRGMYSDKVHDFLNALHAPQVSVCGGDKWRKLKQVLGSQTPSDYGGRAVIINNPLNLNLFNKIENFNEELAKKVWWLILSSNSNQYANLNQVLMNSSEKELENKFNKIIA